MVRQTDKAILAGRNTNATGKKSNEKEIKHEENTATESVMIISSNYQNYESSLFAKKEKKRQFRSESLRFWWEGMIPSFVAQELI